MYARGKLQATAALLPGKIPHYALNRMLVGPRNIPKGLEVKKLFLSLARIEMRFFGSTYHGLVTMSTALFFLHEACNKR